MLRLIEFEDGCYAGIFGVDELTPHPVAQRKFRPQHKVIRSEDAFNRALAGALSGVEEDGKVYIAEGQHRLEKARIDGVESVLVVVARAGTEAADVFLKANGLREKVQPGEEWNVLLKSKKDPLVTEIQRLIEERGGALDGIRAGRGGDISAFNTLRKKIGEADGPERVRDILDLTLRAFGKLNQKTCASHVLEGWQILLKWHPRRVAEVVAERLAAEGVEGLTRRSGIYSGNGVSKPKAAYLAMLDVYNYKRRSGRIQPYGTPRDA